jgi:hypothetical protein
MALLAGGRLFFALKQPRVGRRTYGGHQIQLKSRLNALSVHVFISWMLTIALGASDMHDLC